ncbi:MAG: biotin/lipoyl-binding protein [Prevotella sp.]|nr:biotin/lipoyl-binding protein [Prevotella sp.]
MNKYQYKVQGVDYDVEIEEVEGNVAKVNVNGIRFDVELKQPINPTSTLKKVHIEAPKPVARPTVAPAAPAAAPAADKPTAAGTGSAVKAPLPGTVLDIKVNVGDTVKVGDIVLVLEAMKMQNNIESEFEGTVTSIVIKQGESVMEGAVMMTIG